MGKNQLETPQFHREFFFLNCFLKNCNFANLMGTYKWSEGWEALVNSAHNPAMWILSSFHLVQPKFVGKILPPNCCLCAIFV